MRPAEWASVLDAIYHAQPADEQTWLEWKSRLDLRSKEQMATLVAKAIIAFANRDPTEAAACVGGIGILVIGVEPGNVSGVVQIDNADLDQMLTSYLGSDGPVWQPHWDQYKGETVLIIEVSAPAWGDPPHAFRKEYANIGDGAIYVRRRARSVPADHRDIRRLVDRYANRPDDNTLDITIGVDDPTMLSRYTWTGIDTFIEAERERLLGPITEVRHTERTRDLAGRRMGAGMDPEARTVEEYKDEVERYLDETRARWPEIMRSLAAYLLPTTLFTVTNLSARNYRQLEVRLHVAGDADAIEFEEDLDSLDFRDLLPRQPREWGPRPRNVIRGIVQSSYLPSVPPFTPAGPRTILERGGSFTLRVQPLDLRPRQTEVLEDAYVLLIPASRTDEVIVSWSATATNVDATAHGQFALPLEGPDVNLMEAWAQTEASRQEANR